MKGIAYLRVSTAGQELSPEAQIEKIRKFADYRDIELVGVFSDLAVSGRSRFEEREGGRAALAALETADVIIFAKLSRAFRNAADAMTLVPRLVKAGKDVYFLDLGVNLKTPTGKMVMGMLAVQAEWEADIIGERTKEALAAARAGGKRIGGVPYGMRPTATFSSDGKKVGGGVWANVPEEQESIDRVVELRRDRLYAAEVARRLNAEGRVTKQGKAWTHTHVLRVERRIHARA